MIELAVQLACAWFFCEIFILCVLCALMIIPFWVSIMLIIVFIYPYVVGLMKVIEFIGEPIKNNVINFLSVISVLLLLGSKTYEVLDIKFWNGITFGIQQYISIGVVSVVFVACVIKYVLLKFQIIETDERRKRNYK